MSDARPIRKLMCANRGEIAIRVFRAGTELGLRTVAIYSHQDRVVLHRYKADESYLVGRGKSPVAAYLDIADIIRIAKAAEVDAIHPGYGFLSESAAFCEACGDAGIAFVGPPPSVLRALGDKTAARTLAQSQQVPVVPGSEGPVATLADAQVFADGAGFPLIIKAAHGGGGRGMRVVRDAAQLPEAFERAQSEALASFGDGTVFIERFVQQARHIEVQILADALGNVIHLGERDCSVQRRHQKVVEIAPAQNLDDALRDTLCSQAVRLAKAVGYRSAGTVEFLVEPNGRHYFIEANPRIQVEHTVTEAVTQVDLVASQILIAGGATLNDLNLRQHALRPRGVAIQCRVTTEDPAKGFQPGTGKLEVFRSGAGMGIRLDGGAGYAGAVISPDYDSLLVKVTGHAKTFAKAAEKLHRALAEFRIRGVPTNIPFLHNVLRHPRFLNGSVDTSFIDDSPELFRWPRKRNRAQRLLKFFGEIAVNGSDMASMQANARPSTVEPVVVDIDSFTQDPSDGWRQRLLQHGPAEFAKAVRRHRGLLITDTTWRDAHQSLLATRVRTIDLLRIAPATAKLYASAFSLEMWGGATFDVALRFLHECPWDRLTRLRERVPNIPFQMLLRGANAVGYTNYPDNVVKRFTKLAAERGIDIFRIFDALNYVENMKLGIDAVGEAGGVIEACICYTGDVTDPTRTKYSLSYYVDRVGELVERGIHLLAIKDMAGLLKPAAARLLVGTIRQAYPELPIHVHTHDTVGTGVASMLACAEADADVIDTALPAMAGLTSQPTISGVAAALSHTGRAIDISSDAIQQLNAYWEEARGLYAPFESGLKGYAPDLHLHEIPGGQYTNLRFQAHALGLAERWGSIKQRYAQANQLLGDLIKVTPSSKVVGDLAQFMVQNDLDAEQVRAQAETLSFPQSVVDFMAGKLGVPYGGYPEPLRTHVLKGQSPIEGRPGASMPPLDLAALAQELRQEEPETREEDVISAALYPRVYAEYREHRRKYSDVSVVPTHCFLAPLSVGKEIAVEIERGKTLVVVMTAVGEPDDEGYVTVYFELNGQPRRVRIRDRSAESLVEEREKADQDNDGSVGAPMPGTVIEVRTSPGEQVEAGGPLVVLSAMKMETVVASPIAGCVSRIAVAEGDVVSGGDLLVELT